MRLTLIGLALLAAACARDDENEAPAIVTGGAVEADLEHLHEVPDFVLLERAGAPFGKRDLLGKVWVADFIFTRCTGPCHAMCEKARALQSEFPSDDLRVVTTTVDPAYDTASVLTEFAKRYGADPKRWVFLTGDWPSIRAFAGVDGLKLNGNWDEPMAHSRYFVLVDRAGVVRGYYDVLEGEGRWNKLRADVRTLLDEETP